MRKKSKQGFAYCGRILWQFLLRMCLQSILTKGSKFIELVWTHRQLFKKKKVTSEIERVNLKGEVSIFKNYLLFFFYRGELHQVAVDKWPVVSDDNRQRMARMAAAAAWGLGKIFLWELYLTLPRFPGDKDVHNDTWKASCSIKDDLKMPYRVKKWANNRNGRQLRSNILGVCDVRWNKCRRLRVL